MSDGCPTCSHTLSALTSNGVTAFWHCERCGTVVESMYDGKPIGRNAYVPKLVGRCREFEKIALSSRGVEENDVWHRLGIPESINLPENRT